MDDIVFEEQTAEKVQFDEPVSMRFDNDDSTASLGADYTLFSENIQMNRSNSGEEGSSYLMSERTTPQQMYSRISTRESMGSANPYDLEFRGMKLQKKRNKRGRKEPAEQKVRRKAEEVEIDFLSNEPINKAAILKSNKESGSTMSRKIV